MIPLLRVLRRVLPRRVFRWLLGRLADRAIRRAVHVLAADIHAHAARRGAEQALARRRLLDEMADATGRVRALAAVNATPTRVPAHANRLRPHFDPRSN